MDKDTIYEEKRKRKNMTNSDFLKALLKDPLFILIIVSLSLYSLYHLMGVYSFLWGYHNFLTGKQSTPITPYSIGMTVVGIVAITATLIRRKARIWHTLPIAVATMFSALVIFEFIWNLIFIIQQGEWNSWFGFPLPVYFYYFAFLSTLAFWFAGLGYWRITRKVAFVWMVTFIVFLAWYLDGYPQTWYSSAITAGYLFNVAAKIMISVAFMAPYLSGMIRPGKQRSKVNTV